MRTLTVRKVGETEKAVQYCVTFWRVEHPDTLYAVTGRSSSLTGGSRNE